MKRILSFLLLFATIHAWTQSTSDIGKVLATDGKMYKTGNTNTTLSYRPENNKSGPKTAIALNVMVQ